MKCYKHPKIDAIGVCHECGEGICNKCAVKIGGKLYCKDDADKVFGEKKATTIAAAESPASKGVATGSREAKALKSNVLGMSSTAWFLAILGWFMFPPFCWGIGLILGYVAVSRATDNLNVFSKANVAVCGIGALMNLAFLGWWAINMVDLISMFTSI